MSFGFRKIGGVPAEAGNQWHAPNDAGFPLSRE